MASLLRQIVAGPRSRHPEAGLDLCYVTPFIIATSGPSSSGPSRAWRNPLDQLVKFLDYKHKDAWTIWEFRAEGTGYPDEEVYGRVCHYPWPDHHPPPFRLVPMIMGSMRNWLTEGKEENGNEGKGRVVVVHCKAGKGRSGTMACSYLIAECGWDPAEALARFTERRMRPGFGQGVSIPSQLRWIGYVERWARKGKVYVERQIEIMEVHVWGLREGVKVAVEGFVDEGKTIKVFHTFSKKERTVMDGKAPGPKAESTAARAHAGSDAAILDGPQDRKSKDQKRAQTTPAQAIGSSNADPKAEPHAPDETGTEAGGQAVIFKPKDRVILPTSDVNIDLERRNRATYGWTMVTSIAHVWWNAYFEGNGPEQAGKADDSGVFEIEWEKMDGIKGSSRKGIRALDKLAVVWRVYEPEPGRKSTEDVVREPSTGEEVPQMAPADWKGDNKEAPGKGKDLGLRVQSPSSASVSAASSVKDTTGEDTNGESDGESLKGVKSSGPEGEAEFDADDMDVKDLPQPTASAPEPDLAAVNAGLDTASSTTPAQAPAKK